ncbi:hypothetical protein B6N60_00252 [Richelia sinica FACHB-800]|uniref:DUF1838 domain-containing protein n=1 Tax=Richelia sinica FACHB-800 TaxID=1357546 RepID=A0A975T434_9NOST|nr:DUF1838 domain-containing protein [Richelia sinica]MBD2665814.1 DUF1838 domain-containing protein [Richelia sinica FACHB-800]QXE21575.1 hypothetical protein B6N60_00252 [Richelia sinica FACHB-800]
MVAEIQEIDAKQWVKTRSSLDANESSFIVWSGKIYSFVPGEKRQILFKILGMSVSRCIPTSAESWDFTSRELTYYLHPQTDEILHKWENPWTGETVPVMHVANNPVQGKFKGKFPVQVDGDKTTFAFDLFPSYPNPLAADPQFNDYCPSANYQAAELFKISVPSADLANPNLNSATELWLSWDRMGQWLPWMRMGDRSGYLIYSATGSKVKDFPALPELLKTEINTRVPLYRQAPKAYIEGEDMTSWLYFQKHFDAYLAGEQFPIPAAAEAGE